MYEITMELVAAGAKRRMLEAGHHAITIIVDGTVGAAERSFDALPDDSVERHRLLFDLGFSAGQNEDFGEITRIFYISEVWSSALRPGTRQFVRPSVDPNRVEKLAIASRSVTDTTVEVMSFVISRDTDGNLLDMTEEFRTGTDDAPKVRSPLLDAFVDGIVAAKAERR